MAMQGRETLSKHWGRPGMIHDREKMYNPVHHVRVDERKTKGCVPLCDWLLMARFVGREGTASEAGAYN